MNINLLNQYIRNIYVDRCNKSFEELLININNIIDETAYLTHEEYEDKIINGLEDIKQNILLNIWLELSNKLIVFDSEKEVKDYILKIAEGLLLQTRS